MGDSLFLSPFMWGIPLCGVCEIFLLFFDFFFF